MDEIYVNQQQAKKNKTEITGEEQVAFMESSLAKLDEATVANFEQLKTKYLAKVDATIQREINGELVDLQMLQSYMNEVTLPSINMQQLMSLPAQSNFAVIDMNQMMLI